MARRRRRRARRRDHRARNALEPGDVAGAVRALVGDYERMGDANFRWAATSERLGRLAALLDDARAGHQAWLVEMFGDHLPAEAAARRRASTRCTRRPTSTRGSCCAEISACRRRETERTIADLVGRRPRRSHPMNDHHHPPPLPVRPDRRRRHRARRARRRPTTRRARPRRRRARRRLDARLTSRPAARRSARGCTHRTAPRRRPEDDPYPRLGVPESAAALRPPARPPVRRSGPRVRRGRAAAIDEQRPDLVVCSMFVVGGMVAAEAAGVPFDVLFPNAYLLPTPGMPPFGLGLQPAKGLAGRLRDRAMTRLIGRLWDKGLRAPQRPAHLARARAGRPLLRPDPPRPASSRAHVGRLRLPRPGRAARPLRRGRSSTTRPGPPTPPGRRRPATTRSCSSASRRASRTR